MSNTVSKFHTTEAHQELDLALVLPRHSDAFRHAISDMAVKYSSTVNSVRTAINERKHELENEAQGPNGEVSVSAPPIARKGLVNVTTRQVLVQRQRRYKGRQTSEVEIRKHQDGTLDLRAEIIKTDVSGRTTREVYTFERVRPSGHLIW